MDSTLKEGFLILDKIKQNVNNKSWNCIYHDCKTQSINSHLLQKNGILSFLSENNSITQFSVNETFEMLKKGRHSFKLKTLKQAISLPLFCNHHDTNIFKTIEIGQIDFLNYEVQLLFSYRALCAEMRRKEMVMEEENRILKSHILSSIFGKDYFEDIKTHIKGSLLGIKDLKFYQKEFEKNIQNIDLKLFDFKVFKYHQLQVCTSAVFTPVKTNLLDSVKLLSQKKAWDSVMISIIPQMDGLYIIAGYHKDYTSNWIKNYINSLDTKDKKNQEINISNLFATRINTCVFSNSTFKSISDSKKKLFIDYWEENSQNYLDDQFWGVNLFD